MDRLALLITVDSLRADRVDSTGSGTDRGLTPHLDDLAVTGTNCVDAFATGPGTRQSFPGILSSTPPLAYGGYNRLGPDRPTIAERFRDVGFTTCGIHSNAQLSSDFGYSRGFDSFFDLSPSATGGSNNSGTSPSLIDTLRDYLGKWLSSQTRIYQTAKRFETRISGLNRPYATATRTRERAEEWLMDQSGDVFLWVHLMDVHVPYYPPSRFRHKVGCGDIRNPKMVDLWMKLNTEPEAVDHKELANLTRLYNATVRYVDEEIGRLVETARTESTQPLVVVTADHGEEFREHGGLTHSPQLYTELIHVPLIFNLPGQSATTVQSPTSLLDIGPTLLSAVDGCINGLWGDDVRDVPNDRAVFSEVAQAPDDPNDDISRDARITACRTSDRTYIRDDLHSREEAYDRKRDPREQESLDEISSELQERVYTFRRRVDETSPELLERKMSGSVESRLQDLGYLQK